MFDRNPSTRAFLLALTLLAGCGRSEPSMNEIARDYVKLVLSVGEFDESYVDAYYGPPELSEQVAAEPPSLQDIHSQATGLLERLGGLSVEGADELVGLRKEFLSTQLRSLRARVELLQGATLSFDEESRALYDAVAPTFPDEHFRSLLDQLDALLPGDGPLTERYESFKSAFVIPVDRLDAVFSKAIDACRERTRPHIELPEGESFVVEYVTDKAWSGYNWYQGSFNSLIQINTDLPIYIDRAVDLACHEGYPGHHLYNSLLEQHLVVDRGWVEYTVYPLYSPQSLIAEGTANYGIEIAFPGDERAIFERDELFPLAGLDPATAQQFYEIQHKVYKLEYAGNEAARRYLDGEIDAEQAAAYLTTHALMPPARAAQRVRFIDQYRSYVINYNLGQDLVAAYVERLAGDDPERRWDVFERLISSPRLPAGLN